MPDTSHTILIVEDERPLLEAIRLKLEHNDFEVLTARSVEQALGYIQDGIAIHAIWLDHYLLGQETGLDLVARLKETKGLKHLPIFVVSNSGSPEKQHSYMRLGTIKYYIKADYRLDQIVQEIKGYLEHPDEQISPE